jgi:hypothetical protein
MKTETGQREATLSRCFFVWKVQEREPERYYGVIAGVVSQGSHLEPADWVQDYRVRHRAAAHQEAEVTRVNLLPHWEAEEEEEVSLHRHLANHRGNHHLGREEFQEVQRHCSR